MKDGRPRIHPGLDVASRILSRGLLLNALLGSFLGCARGEPGSPKAPKQLNVILILVDTLRADHLGAYGYDKDTSPRIDAFASRAMLYENAISQAPHTIPSVLQIMTSKHRQGHELDPQSLTLAKILQESGYETVAIVDNAHFEHDPDAHGLKYGFDRFYRNGLLHRDNVEQQHWKSKTPADAIVAQARRWLRKRDPDRPFFMWLHFFDPHDPYMPPFSDDMEELTWESDSSYTGDIRNTFLFRPSRDGDPESFTEVDRRHITNLYDAEIKYLDQALGEFLDFLDEQGLREDALVVLSADHGESLGEHDTWFHGRTLYDPEIHIPLIVKFPRQNRGERVASPAQAIDIFPTILDVAGVDVEVAVDGESLLESRPPRPAFTFWRNWQVVREARWKLLQREDGILLFDLDRDPGETLDLSGEHPETVRRLLAEAVRRLDEIQASSEELEALSSEAVERMRSLGYLD